MLFPQFQQHLTNLITTAETMLASSRTGKPEENTKDSLIVPFLDALGYTTEYRTLEGAIRSLIGTTTWVDYLLRNQVGKHPKLMFEAKSLWDKNIWETNTQQVLDYLRNYSLDIGTQEPVLWIILSNFREWHIFRLQDRKPFWSFTLEELKNDPELVNRVYTCLHRENLSSNRLEAFYSEKTREELGTKFLTDLKIWRVIIANGIKKSQPNLSLDKIREAAQIILNRFLLIRLLETFSREMPFNYLGRVYYNWQQTFPNLPFIEQLRQAFRSTWLDYNTELFQPSWIDELTIDVEYLESIIVINAVPQPGILDTITGTLANYRSIYNYDFTTLTQDILGTAYEQFLAHQLILVNDVVQILENQITRKKEGIFYTPNYILRRIVYQSLQPLIKPKIDQAIGLLKIGELQQAYLVAKSVLEITVLDTACGSGSFLLGAFDYLLTEIKRYNQACQNAKIPENFDLFSHVAPQPIINPEEQILVKMLHGVDRDPQAVLLAKLSLWTRLLRARPGEYGRRNGSIYSHLPALTLNIRVGDSLIHSPANLEPFSQQLTIVANLANIDIFHKIDSQGVKLRKLPECDLVEQGIQTGENKIFAPEQGFPSNFPKEKLYQIVKNSGILAYGFIPDNSQLLYIESSEKFADLSIAIQKYLLANRNKLETRAAYQEGSCEWYALHRSRRKDQHSHFRPKILCPYRSTSNRFSVDLEGNLAGLTDTTAIFLRDIYCYDPDDLKLDKLYALVALLNSQVLEFRYRALGGIGNFNP
jgi:type I restriction-modification system DNA methylase subunit